MINNKKALLTLENVNMDKYFIPKKGTALWKDANGVMKIIPYM